MLCGSCHRRPNISRVIAAVATWKCGKFATRQGGSVEKCKQEKVMGVSSKEKGRRQRGRARGISAPEGCTVVVSTSDISLPALAAEYAGPLCTQEQRIDF